MLQPQLVLPRPAPALFSIISAVGMGSFGGAGGWRPLSHLLSGRTAAAWDIWVIALFFPPTHHFLLLHLFYIAQDNGGVSLVHKSH